jgi:hypothetical protein
MRQTPRQDGLWGDVRFTEQDVDRCDYVIILNSVPKDTTAVVPSGNIWCFIQEPPIPENRWMEKGFLHCQRVYWQDPRHRGGKFIHAHGSLPWHVGKSYDQLLVEPPGTKTANLCWITSAAGVLPGHRRRLAFLDRMRASGVEFNLFGRGFTPIDDKWDVLSTHRYGLAVENHSGPDYWTEKIADCYLAWTMPLYYGAANIDKYFPPESYVWIDIEDPSTPKRIAEIIRGRLAERNRDAIAEARRRVLEEHQLFPRVSRLIAEDALPGSERTPVKVSLPYNPDLTGYYLENGFVKRALLSARRKSRKLLADLRK